MKSSAPNRSHSDYYGWPLSDSKCYRRITQPYPGTFKAMLGHEMTVSRILFPLSSFQEYDNSTDTKYVPYYIDCASSYRNEWLYVFYAYKGLMLAFGVFLAFETRNVTVPALNDSRYIGLSIYNVVFPCALGITVVSVIDNAPDVWYAVLSVLVVFCTSITLCFVFIPKVSSRMMYVKNKNASASTR